MNPKSLGHNYLVILQHKVGDAVINPSGAWGGHHIAGLSKMYHFIEKLLKWWDESVTETTSGFILVSGSRNRFIAYTTDIIVQKQQLALSIDAEGQALLEEVDELLEDLSDVILEIASFADSA